GSPAAVEVPAHHRGYNAGPRRAVHPDAPQPADGHRPSVLSPQVRRGPYTRGPCRHAAHQDRPTRVERRPVGCRARHDSGGACFPLVADSRAVHWIGTRAVGRGAAPMSCAPTPTPSTPVPKCEILLAASRPSDKRSYAPWPTRNGSGWVASTPEEKRDLEQSVLKGVELTGAEVFFLAAYARAGPGADEAAVEQQTTRRRARTAKVLLKQVDVLHLQGAPPSRAVLDRRTTRHVAARLHAARNFATGSA